EATSFTPREWVYPGQVCNGVRITLTDRNRLDTPLLGLELMAALWNLHPDRFQIDRTLGLLGSRASLEAVKAGGDPKEIARSWQPGLDDFAARRSSHLLY
ncbi:MAG: DUF1343 domain-containing protein, partial [Alphaproteobacteria bacterium]|nr:DUF1343 domain-containing protein [Alphaproteobacteria bacterium]